MEDRKASVNIRTVQRHLLRRYCGDDSEGSKASRDIREVKGLSITLRDLYFGGV